VKAFEHLRVGRSKLSKAVATVVLDRPKAGNAMSDQTLREISGAFHVLSADKDLRAVIVTGEGKHFCAGADIDWMRRAGKLPPDEGKKDARLLVDMLSAVRDCPVPVIVAAQGAVYGGGLGLMAACDVGIAAEDARFCFSECRLGIMPAVISCFVLPKIGAAAARRWYLTSEVFDAPRAQAMGLVHEVVPAASLESRAEAVVAEVLKNGPNAVRAAKDLLLRFEGWTPAQRVDNVLDTLVRLRSSPEGQEGLSAFFEKRPPSWAKKS
jgi:methylglutaconyl-CoA hydratase